MNTNTIIILLLLLCCCCYCCISSSAGGGLFVTKTISFESCNNYGEYCKTINIPEKQELCEGLIFLKQIVLNIDINSADNVTIANKFPNKNMAYTTYAQYKQIIQNNKLSCKKNMIFNIYLLILLTILNNDFQGKKNPELLNMINKFYIINTVEENKTLLPELDKKVIGNLDNLKLSISDIAYFDASDRVNNTPVLPNDFDKSIFTNIFAIYNL